MTVQYCCHLCGEFYTDNPNRHDGPSPHKPEDCRKRLEDQFDYALDLLTKADAKLKELKKQSTIQAMVNDLV